ncbi:hypothetical protein ACTFIU_003686 [Dictyostelium citrinum]
MDILFFKVWRNLYIRNKILLDLELFEKNNTIVFYSLYELKNLKNKGYVKSIIYSCRDVVVTKDEWNSFTSLETINFLVPVDFKIVKELPNWIKEIKLDYFDDLLNFDCSFYPKSLTSLSNLNYNTFPIINNNGYDDEDYDYEEDDYDNYGYSALSNNNLQRPIKIPENIINLDFCYVETFDWKLSKIFKDSHKNKKLVSLSINDSVNDNGDSYLTIGDITNSFPSLKILKLPHYKVTLIPPPSLKSSTSTSSKNKKEKDEKEEDDKPQPLEKLIPKSVTDLSIGIDHNVKIVKGSIPNHIKSLSLQRMKTLSTIDKPTILSIEENSIPLSITKLEIDCTRINQLSSSSSSSIFPNSIKWLKLHGNSIKKLTKQILPNSLEVLEISDEIEIEDGSLPDTLKTLKIFSSFNNYDDEGNITNTIHINGNNESKVTHKLVSPIPQSVTCLSIDTEFIEPIKPGDIPNSVTQLEFGKLYNHSLSTVGIIPSNIRTLKILNRISIEPSVLSSSSSLVNLIINSDFNLNTLTTKNGLPSSLFRIIFLTNILNHSNYNSSINDLNIPSSIRIVNRIIG